MKTVQTFTMRVKFFKVHALQQEVAAKLLTPGSTFTTHVPASSADTFNRSDYEDPLITH